jgi:hypothetical protein
MTMSAPGMPPPGVNGRVIAISPLFEKIVVGLLGIIITMIGGGYFGLNARINRLEDHFQTAMAADVEIKDLLKNSPHLIQDINGINKTVLELKGSMEALKTMPQQIQTLQQGADKLQIQTNNIQKQIHTIPGVQ